LTPSHFNKGVKFAYNDVSDVSYPNRPYLPSVVVDGILKEKMQKYSLFRSFDQI